MESVGLVHTDNVTAGLTYCALDTLSFLELIPSDRIRCVSPGSAEFEALVRFLVSCQTNELEEAEEDDDEDELVSVGYEPAKIRSAVTTLEERIVCLPNLPEASSRPEKFFWAGFNGRTNKLADTCYCFWVSASLAVCKSVPLLAHS